VGNGCRSAPEARTACFMPEYIDEQTCLAVLFGAGRRGQRHCEIRADVRDHAPDHRVADLVESRESEQLERLEQLDAERTVLEQTKRQPSGTGKSRQEQRIEPD